MKQQLRKEIGMRIREIRRFLGYTQVQMVSFFDIGRANYSRIEKGEIFPAATILSTLRKEFKVSLDWLITGEGGMFHHQKQKKEEKKSPGFGEYTEEINDLLFHLQNVPMVRHALLGFFLEYKTKNQHIIRQILEEDTPLLSSEQV
ncbi:MAG: helix-turn-helix transcriptional regulator [Candidatus Aminicenantes bacterium]|nr:MAG: helix-turn-helix transcriptional regulator [Candidatus Aminicenantes bacterium]